MGRLSSFDRWNRNRSRLFSTIIGQSFRDSVFNVTNAGVFVLKISPCSRCTNVKRDFDNLESKNLEVLDLRYIINLTRLSPRLSHKHNFVSNRNLSVTVTVILVVKLMVVHTKIINCAVYLNSNEMTENIGLTELSNSPWSFFLATESVKNLASSF